MGGGTKYLLYKARYIVDVRDLSELRETQGKEGELESGVEKEQALTRGPR